MASYVKKCFVPSCKNTSVNSTKVFITVPTKAEQRRKWYEVVGRDFSKSSAYCCEDHFVLKEDVVNWLAYSFNEKRIQLKEGVVPHKNLLKATDLHTSQLTDSAKKRKKLSYAGTKSTSPEISTKAVIRKLFDDSEEKIQKKRKIYENPSAGPSWMPDPEIGSSEMFSDEQLSWCDDLSLSGTVSREAVISSAQACLVTDHKTVATQTRLPYHRSIAVTTKTSSYSSIATSPLKFTQKTVLSSPQSSSSSLVSEPVVSTEWAVSTVTGSSDENQELAVSNLKETQRVTTVMWIENNSRFYLGIPKDTYFVVKLLDTKCPVTYTNILIVLKKIRLYDSNFRLGIEFGLDKSTVARAFATSIEKIAEYFKSLIIWPKKNLIQRQLPISFRARYKEVQSIIDCLEIEIEKPSSAIQQALTWSEYKKTNTMKYLISATPDGIVNFISNGYGGRITDKLLTETCGYLETLPPGCSVMADRGFKHIEPLLKKKHCTLIRPPSISSDSKSTKEEVKLGKRIASLRIHVERVIRRLREFYMLSPHACVNHKLIWTLDYAIIIACGIINLQGPLIKK